VSIDEVEHPGLVAVGVRVDGTWETLPRDVPAAWRTVFARRAEIADAAGELRGFAGISISVVDGWFEEFVGAVVDDCHTPPSGMVVLDVPPNRYLRCIHRGPLREAYVSFGRLGESGRARGLEMTEVKLDFGYDEGLTHRPHELFRAVGPAAQPTTRIRT
jgi:predicted transcriptional regulator YdeE